MADRLHPDLYAVTWRFLVLVLVLVLAGPAVAFLITRASASGWLAGDATRNRTAV